MGRRPSNRIHICAFQREAAALPLPSAACPPGQLTAARSLYCTTLIRSAQYHLPRGLETSSRPLLSLLIRLALLMGFAYWWGFGCSLHIIPGPQWRASPPTVSSSLMLCLHSWLCLRLCTLNPLPLCTFDISASKCYSHISRGVCSFLLARPFYPKPRIRTQSHM